jgi:hypothetical protein
MSDMLSRRNALVGWAVWTLAKRRLLGARAVEPSRPSWRRRLLRTATAVAVLALIGVVWARHSRTRSVSREPTSGPANEPPL